MTSNKKACRLWGLNPRVRKHRCLKPAPQTARANLLEISEKLKNLMSILLISEEKHLFVGASLNSQSLILCWLASSSFIMLVMFVQGFAYLQPAYPIFYLLLCIMCNVIRVIPQAIACLDDGHSSFVPTLLDSGVHCQAPFLLLSRSAMLIKIACNRHERQNCRGNN